LTGGILGVVLAGAFWGALAGGLIGGAVGGIAAAVKGGSFLEGFADGALSGAVSGAVTGAACAGLGALGALAGKGIQCLSTLGKAIKITSKVTAALSFGMDGFDMLAMGISLFDPSNALVEFNRKLHSNALYNRFQIAINALAVFTAGAASTMKCFVAGTLILTATGFVAIENIKAGDKVIATNPETFEVAEKTVLETYVRETTELLHLTINGEVIKTTFEHPFYVKDVGFVEARKLQIRDRLVDSRGNVLVLEGKKLEITDKPVKVYNFKVDDFYTYHVAHIGVLVHNANNYKPENSIYIYENGIYEDADYHGRVDNKVKSRRPIDGQFALDNSVEVKIGRSPRRVGIDVNGDFVVLDRTDGEKYHGHVRPWKKDASGIEPLSDKMKSALIKA